jgi:5-hydroxyisourate hydrolase
MKIKRKEISAWPCFLMANRLSQIQHHMDTKSHITTHVLDTTHGVAAKGVRVQLEQQINNQWTIVGNEYFRTNPRQTNQDGRCVGLFSNSNGSAMQLTSGLYRLSFQLDAYFAQYNIQPFFPSAEVIL